MQFGLDGAEIDPNAAKRRIHLKRHLLECKGEKFLGVTISDRKAIPSFRTYGMPCTARERFASFLFLGIRKDKHRPATSCHSAMKNLPASHEFYEALPRVASFPHLTEPSGYTSLPDDWMVGVADIVGSTKHIQAGRYKLVNMVGAAVISSQINARKGRAFPFVFGGDGAAFACEPQFAAESARILGVMKRWSKEEFGLTLRAAQVPLSEIRAAGHDVAVARYQASRGVDYAMFNGGGLSWSEAQMKLGGYSVPSAEPGALPDLNGLSCRWSNATSQNGSIVSVVVQPTPTAAPSAFSDIAGQIVAVVERLNRGGHPLPVAGPGVRWPPPGLSIEAHVSRGKASLTLRKGKLLLENLLAWVFFKTGMKVGEFDPMHYAAAVSSNADFRKFDDGLKMTVDCDPDTLGQLRSILQEAKQDGILKFGLFEQEQAMITCFVPSITQDNHIHLVDGASGGYTKAAAQMKLMST